MPDGIKGESHGKHKQERDSDDKRAIRGGSIHLAAIFP
ncbi:hypothetical protein PLANPX_4985 [Lacipirellula parvula]|uniref:Uncharacterized protein n=1 Tax=Lacipirellula parvula TaxID=2650471 RepID=A0A5K7XLJ5_9BACT|nr:hypothetical protein PLANPX_4985 [Lacipirellula parvula]